MKFSGLLPVLILIAVILPGSAAQVSLSAPQNEFYFPAGEEAIIPLTIVSTYDHDITGTLKTVMIPVNAGTDGSGPRDTSVHTQSFSAFTELRTVPLAVGRSDTPGDYFLTILFSYPEGGGRTSTMGPVKVHYITEIGNPPANHEQATSTDSANPAAAPGSDRSPPEKRPQGNDPATALQNSQLAQDVTALQDQMAKEHDQSVNSENELLQHVRADPLVQSLESSLSGAGFSLNKTEIFPVSNRSGNFILRYSSGPEDVTISGVMQETRALFAEESSEAAVPLPDILTGNVTYQEYHARVTENSFLQTRARLNVTPGTETVNLTFSNPAHRIVRLDAYIENGTLVTVEGESPEDPFATLTPVAGLVAVLLISAGIWHLARTHRNDLPVPDIAGRVPGPDRSIREIAGSLLDEAEQDAARGSWPEAYRKTGRAIRIVLSHEKGCGDELTSGQVEQILDACCGDTETIRWVLGRCRLVGYAKDLPVAGEFPLMVGIARGLAENNEGGTGLPD